MDWSTEPLLITTVGVEEDVAGGAVAGAVAGAVSQFSLFIHFS